MHERKENICFSELSTLFFLTPFFPLALCVNIHPPLWCTRLVHACLWISEQDATMPVSTHVGVAAWCACAASLSQGNQGQRSSSEWLWMRDAALNDPQPRASLSGLTWRSACAGHLLDLDLFTRLLLFASPVHLGYGNTAWQNKTRDSLTRSWDALMRTFMPASMCLWYTNSVNQYSLLPTFVPPVMYSALPQKTISVIVKDMHKQTVLFIITLIIRLLQHNDHRRPNHHCCYWESSSVTSMAGGFFVASTSTWLAVGSVASE